jgi:hypothetical protein
MKKGGYLRNATRIRDCQWGLYGGVCPPSYNAVTLRQVLRLDENAVTLRARPLPERT